jgi:hypothetical protein
MGNQHMSLELFNHTTSISRKYSRQFLEKALELARISGWQPMGTRPPLERDIQFLNADWLGTYLTNDGQVVCREDALSLAYALEISLDDIPDAEPDMNWNPKLLFVDDLPEWLSPAEKAMIEDGLEDHSPELMNVHPFEFFAGKEKRYLIGVIRFSQLGSFTIL